MANRKKPIENMLCFNINMPAVLIPAYIFLQNELDYFMSDTKCRKLFNHVNLHQAKGKVWREIHPILAARIKTWPIKNKAWYGRIVEENIRRELLSKEDTIKIYNALQENNNKINEDLYTKLSKQRVQWSMGRIVNISRMKKAPIMPTHATFVFDLSVTDKQMFIKDENNNCHMQLPDGSWFDYQINIPSSVFQTATGRISKPRFMRRASDNTYIGTCSYEYTPIINGGRNGVLGVDIGKKKLFSAVCLQPDGTYGIEYTNSTKCEIISGSIKRLYKEKDLLSKKIERLENYNNSEQTTLRVERQRISSKIENAKKVLARNLAKEIINTAIKTKAREIHIENLSWMGSIGGKWNHEEIHKSIIEEARKYSIPVIKVSAAYSSSTNPVTGERGIARGRKIVFSAGKTIDRDTLAAINLAARKRNKKAKPNKVNRLKRRHEQPRRAKLTKSRKQEIKSLVSGIKRNTQIVVLSPFQRSLFDERLWLSCIRTTKDSFLPRLRDLHLFDNVSICDNL